LTLNELETKNGVQVGFVRASLSLAAHHTALLLQSSPLRLKRGTPKPGQSFNAPLTLNELETKNGVQVGFVRASLSLAAHPPRSIHRNPAVCEHLQEGVACAHPSPFRSQLEALQKRTLGALSGVRSDRSEVGDCGSGVVSAREFIQGTPLMLYQGRLTTSLDLT
jgi:hypothetical protein